MSKKTPKKPFGFLANVGKDGNNGHWSNESKDTWSVGQAPKECKNCSYSEDIKGYSIRVHPDVFAAIFYLCAKVKDEWQMLLTGAVQDNTVFCNGYYIPQQEVTAASVKNLEAIDKEFIDEHEVVATIHSHANMAVFFSNVDDEFTNMSFIKHHIVVNNAGDFVSKSRIDLPCNMVKFVTSKVETMIPQASSLTGEEKITKRTYVTPYEHNGHGWRGGEYKGQSHYESMYDKTEKSFDDGFIRNKYHVWVHKDTLTKDELKELEAINAAQDGVGY